MGVDFRGVGAPHLGPRLHDAIAERGVQVDNWGIHRRGIGAYEDFINMGIDAVDTLQPEVRNFAGQLAHRECLGDV